MYGYLKRRTKGVYELTPEGLDVLLASVPELTLELVLAGRLVHEDLNLLGKRDRAVIRFRSGTIASYATGGKASEGDKEITLGLDPLEQWPGAAEVEAELERLTPERED